MSDEVSGLNLVREEEGLFARDFDGQLVRMDRVTAEDLLKQISIKIDGHEVTVPKAVPATDEQGRIRRDSEGRPIPRATTIFDAARKAYVEQLGTKNPIPTLCHQEHLEPVGVCRICVVEIAKVKRGSVQRERKLLPACQHRVEETMEVQTVESPDPAARERVRSAVKTLTEMLQANCVPQAPLAARPYDELAALGARLECDPARFDVSRRPALLDHSSPKFEVDHGACILCDRCVRACSDVKHNFVIGRTGKGFGTHIGFDLDESMGTSSCVECGECVVTCPTSALTFRPTVVAAGGQSGSTGGVSPLTVDELRKHPLFADLPYKFLEWNLGSITRRVLPKQAILCREGEPGSTAFVLLRGRFEISIQASQKEAGKGRASGWRAFFGRSALHWSTATERSPGDSSRMISTDSGQPFRLGKPVAERTAEDVIIGEMTCMSHYPRSATVVTLEESEVYEIGRNILHYLRRNRTAREVLDAAYRKYALADHLDRSELLATLDAEDRRTCVEYLRSRVELVRVDSGQTIFRHGDQTSDFYLIRIGFVRVSHDDGRQEIVLNYLGPGANFGEIGLLSSILPPGELGLEDNQRGLRTATCQALDDVELVVIRGQDFKVLVDGYPRLREKMIERARQLLQQSNLLRRAQAEPLDEFLEQGLFNANRLLVLDLESCTRCDECTRACSDTHDGITRLIREGLRFDRFLVASSCRSCLDPYCLVGCPVDAIHRKPRSDDPRSLEIVIENHCIGCGQCAQNCPYGNINMHGFDERRPDPTNPAKSIRVVQQRATTCDLCRDVVGPGQDTSCVYACPHNAAFRVSGETLREMVKAPRL